jgi:hypothetical protein
MKHSASDIVAQWLQNKLEDDNAVPTCIQEFQFFVDRDINEDNSNSLAVITDPGYSDIQSKDLNDGEIEEKQGVQIRVHATDHIPAQQLVNAVMRYCEASNATTPDTVAMVDPDGDGEPESTVDYQVLKVSRMTGVGRSYNQQLNAWDFFFSARVSVVEVPAS